MKEIKKVFIVDTPKGMIKEMPPEKAPKYARQFRTKKDALSYLLFIQLEHYMDFYTNSNVEKQLAKLQQIIKEIKEQL